MVKKRAVKANAKKAFTSLLPKNAHGLLTAKGVHLIEKIGADAVRDVLHEVFSGRNLRDSTEFLTRKRITALNLALVQMYINGLATNGNFVTDLPDIAKNQLKAGKLSKEEKWLSLWVLGLTEKASQNVLRDNSDALDAYTQKYVGICNEMVADANEVYGELAGNFSVGDCDVELSWNTLASLLNTSGTQTLAIRGSEKSAYGKLFEKLILGSLLSMLGFKYSESQQAGNGVFWLSSREQKRESDATLLYKKGSGIRFDIGFIGRGNSEITLDKVSRFERHAEVQSEKYFMATIIIVDTVGKGSRVEELARDIDGDIVQMSGSYWVREVAGLIKNAIKEFDHPILRLSDAQLEGYLKTELAKIDVLRFLKGVDLEDEPAVELEDEDFL